MTLAIIGFGKMAEAIWRGANPSGDHLVVERDPGRRALAATLGLTAVSYDTAVQSADQVLLCIKPQGFSGLPRMILNNGPTIVSIMAGISITQLQGTFPDCGIVRVMPNTPCTVGQGMTALTFDRVSADDQVAIFRIFESIGDVIECPESWMDAVTGISGSGPAFLYQLCQSVIDASADSGMPADVAVRLFAQTLVGAGRMLQTSGKSYQDLIADVTSPGGTTLAGLTTFNDAQINPKFEQVIRSAMLRSQELSS